MNVFAITLSMAMGAILGFAAHRAGLCTVKAVAEVMTSRRANVLYSFAKSAVWAVAILTVASTFSLESSPRHMQASSLTFLGGLLFGLGAGVNGGCTFSTLSRLMDGNTNLLATVTMWPVGMFLVLLFWPDNHSGEMTNMPPSRAPWWLALMFAFWAILESVLIIRQVMKSGSARRFLFAPVYTLSSGAAVIGIANAVLLLAWGPWSFTGTILCGLDGETLARCGSSLAVPLLISAAAMLGMVLSSTQRASFRVVHPRRAEVLRHAAGGLLMGGGAILIPGGNDGLILFGIPSLSPHAIPAYLGIVAGIAIALISMRASGKVLPPVLCDDDVCRTS